MPFTPFVPPGGGGGAVASVFGRAGVVTALAGDYSVGQVTGAAPLASPAFTGNPTAATQAPGNNSTRLATTAFVDAAFAGAVLMISPSGDHTGVADAAAVNAAIAALPVGADAVRHGTILFAAGVWFIECGQVVADVSGIYFAGMGKWATYVFAVGAGDVFRLFDPSDFDTRQVHGGGVGGMTIDGVNTTNAADSRGVHWGDIFQSKWDVAIVNFAATAGSCNWLADNQWAIGEQAQGLVYCAGGSTNYKWDQNPAVGSTQCSGSFERANMDVYTDQVNASFDGWVWDHGTYITNSFMNFGGNFLGTNGGAVTSAVFRAKGSTPAGSADGAPGAIVSNAQWFGNVGVECAGGSTFTPTTFAVDGAGAFFGPIFGNLNFGAAGVNFTPTTAIVSFFGLTDGGDPGIVAQSSQAWLFQGLFANGTFAPAQVLTNGATIASNVSYTAVAPAAAVTGIIMGAGTFDGQDMDVVNTSTHPVTFAAAGTSLVATGTSCIIPALEATKFKWSVDTNLWYQMRNSAA